MVHTPSRPRLGRLRPGHALALAAVLAVWPAPTSRACHFGGPILTPAALPAALMVQAQLAQAQLVQQQLLQAQLTQQQLLQAQLTRQQLLQARLAPGAFAQQAGRQANAVPAPPVQPGVPAAPRARRRPAAPAPKPAPQAPAEVRVVDHEALASGLAADLVFAPGEEQERLLGRLRDGKGPAYTDALARAIPKLDGEAKARARAALAERLTRMTAGTLRAKLQDDDAEVSRAAALASAMRDDQALVPDLIDRLERDPASPLVPALRAALHSLTGRDFGPAAGAGGEERTRATAAWKAWWQGRASR